MTLLLALVFTASAQTCDAKALTREIAEVSPTGLPAAWQTLVSCDPAAAKAAAPSVIPRLLAGEAANPAAVSAIGVGAGDAVRSWVDKLEPDQRSATIAYLGKKCTSDPAVEGFFIDTHAALGAKFYEQRWVRGLTDCRTPKVQALLTDAVTNAKWHDRSQFFATLQVFARNLGAAAVPTLTGIAKTSTDAEDLLYVVNAYSDAARVGSVEGIDAEAAKAAVAALVEIGPILPAKAVDQGRQTLTALGATDEADGYAAHRWRDRLTDGRYSYAVAATEQVTCKNGKIQAYLHTGVVTEPGKVWPEDLQARHAERIAAGWEITHAAACKGTAELRWSFSGEPLAAPADDWFADQKKSFDAAAAAASKAEAIAHQALAL
jgi:hypothetical protein